MSLAIDLDDVIGVLLADGWHSVANKSFLMDSYEYVSRAETNSRGDVGVYHSGGSHGICAIGFEFLELDSAGWLITISGPLTSILAVRNGQQRPAA